MTRTLWCIVMHDSLTHGVQVIGSSIGLPHRMLVKTAKIMNADNFGWTYTIEHWNY